MYNDHKITLHEFYPNQIKKSQISLHILLDDQVQLKDVVGDVAQRLKEGLDTMLASAEAKLTPEQQRARKVEIALTLLAEAQDNSQREDIKLTDEDFENHPRFTKDPLKTKGK